MNNQYLMKPKNYHKAHLGKKFEDAINLSCEYYRLNNIAIIYKKPTPINVVQVNYEYRGKAKITEAYYAIPSTTDYNGMYKKQYIDFEAKSCLSDYFSFSRLYPHQIEHLYNVYKLGGISFLLICFEQKNEIYIIKTEDLVNIYKVSKAITYNKCKEIGIKVSIKYTPPIDFVKGIDKIIKSASSC